MSRIPGRVGQLRSLGPGNHLFLVEGVDLRLAGDERLKAAIQFVPDARLANAVELGRIGIALLPGIDPLLQKIGGVVIEQFLLSGAGELLARARHVLLLRREDHAVAANRLDRAFDGVRLEHFPFRRVIGNDLAAGGQADGDASQQTAVQNPLPTHGASFARDRASKRHLSIPVRLIAHFVWARNPTFWRGQTAHLPIGPAGYTIVNLQLSIGNYQLIIANCDEASRFSERQVSRELRNRFDRGPCSVISWA